MANRIIYLPKFSPQDLTRFWNYVEIGPEDQCWNWSGKHCPKGYSRLSIQHRTFRASRMMYFLHYGVDPYDLWVLHSCDHPPCINPHHLFLGTNTDNVADKMKKGRHRVVSGDAHWAKQPEHQGRYRGENNPFAKLSDSDIAAIRTLRTEQRLTYAVLAKMYGTSQTHVCRIVHNQCRQDC